MRVPEPGDLWRWKITDDFYYIIELKQITKFYGDEEREYLSLCLTDRDVDVMVFNRWNMDNWEFAA